MDALERTSVTLVFDDRTVAARLAPAMDRNWDEGKEWTVSVFQRMPADPLMHILLDGRPLDWYGLSATDGVLAIEALTWPSHTRARPAWPEATT